MLMRQQLLKSLSAVIFHASNVCCFCVKYTFLEISELETFLFTELTREQIVICEADTDCSSQSIQILFLCLRVIYMTALMGQNMGLTSNTLMYPMFYLYFMFYSHVKTTWNLGVEAIFITFNRTYAYVYFFKICSCVHSRSLHAFNDTTHGVGMKWLQWKHSCFACFKHF